MFLTLSLVCLAALSPFKKDVTADAGHQPTLEVRTDPAGGVQAHATLHIAAPPSVVQAVLTDYAKWPDLFETSLRVAALERQRDRVITDLYITYAPLFGERHLLCEHKELPQGGLITRMLEGDFIEYARTWRLSPDGDDSRTRAELEMRVDLDTWAPDWLLALVLRGELESHFKLVKEKAKERVNGRE